MSGNCKPVTIITYQDINCIKMHESNSKGFVKIATIGSQKLLI